MAMRLRIRTLKNETFEINISSADTIEQVKALIEREKNHPAAHQKLIYNGVILVDNKTVAEYDIKENGFVVLMVKAPAAGASPAAAAGPAKPATAPAAAPATAAPPAKTAAPAPAKTAPPPNQPAADDGGVQPMDMREDVAAAESTLLTNAGQIEATITQLCEMGFPRDDVVKALRAAFNNPNRAVEYLMSGNIPDVGPPAPAANRPPAPAAGGAAAGGGAGGAPLNLFEAADRARQPGGGGAGGAAGGAAGGENIFDFLRHNPEFNALRFMVQQNPALLQPILAQLGQANPDLLQLITAHQAEFTELLNEPVNEADLPQQLGRGGGGGGGGGGGRGVVQIQLTAEEKGAVDRLMGLGFGQQAALEAYLSCDKNEEVAANYLLENGMDMGGDGQDEEGFEEEEGFDDEGFDEGGH